MKYIGSILIAVFLSGCAGGMIPIGQPKAQSSSTNSSSMPKWVINPKQANTQYYYAVGEGQSKDEALKSALAQVSSQISVTIASDTTTSKKLSNNTYQREVEKTIKASTQNIKFSGVTTLENAFFKDSFYTYVQVDRTILFESLKKDFDLKLEKLKTTWQTIESGDPFLIFKNAKYVEETAIELTANLSILKSIKREFNETPYIQKIQQIQTSFESKKSKVLVFVETDTGFKEKELIEKAISEYGIKVTPSLRGLQNKNNLLRIYIKKSAKEVENMTKSRKLQDVVYADVTLVITTYNSTKKTKFAQNIITLRNGTRENYQASVKKTKKFEREIEQQGILKILLENIDS
jgi:hypothetical protein